MSNIVNLLVVLMLFSIGQVHLQQQQETQPTYANVHFPVTMVWNPCLNNPCKSGVCEIMSFGYYCKCNPNFIGQNCDTHPDTYCAENPCQNGAKCSSTAGFEPYSCECVPPFTGKYCNDLKKLDDVVKINVVDSNSQFLLNKTLDIINNEKLMSTSTFKPVADLASNSTNTTNAEPEAPTENSESSAEMESISNLLSNVSSLKEIENSHPEVFFQIFDQVIDKANTKMSEKILDSTQKLSKSLEEYVTNSDLTNNNTFYILQADNFAVISFKVNDTNETSGSKGFSQNVKSDIDIVTNKTTVDFKSVNSAAFIKNRVLTNHSSEPVSVFSFAVYEKSTMFDVNSSQLQNEDHDCSSVYDNQIVTSVISVNTNAKIVSDKNFVLTLFRTNPTVNKCGVSEASKKYTCVFWDYTGSVWNSSGCHYSNYKGLHSCECNHLTNFAVLMTIDNSLNECETCEIILKYASYAGSIASIVCLSVLIVFYLKDLIKKKIKKSRIGFKSMFDYYVQILISLSFTLLFMNTFYIVFSTVSWKKEGLPYCITISVILHYLLLSSFCWMLSFALLQYLTFNKVFVVIKNYYLYTVVFSLGAPLIPIITILSIDWRLYQGPTFDHCWLSGYSIIFGVIVPICTIIVINIIVFGLILKKHCSACYTENKAGIKNTRKQTIILATSFVNLGITWSLAFVLFIPMQLYLKTTIAVLFCLFNSLQGFFLFIVYIVMAKSKRELIKNGVEDKFRKICSVFSGHPDERNTFYKEATVSSKNTTLGSSSASYSING